MMIKKHLPGLVVGLLIAGVVFAIYAPSKQEVVTTTNTTDGQAFFEDNIYSSMNYVKPQNGKPGQTNLRLLFPNLSIIADLSKEEVSLKTTLAHNGKLTHTSVSVPPFGERNTIYQFYDDPKLSYAGLLDLVVTVTFIIRDKHTGKLLREFRPERLIGLSAFSGVSSGRSF